MERWAMTVEKNEWEKVWNSNEIHIFAVDSFLGYEKKVFLFTISIKQNHPVSILFASIFLPN